MATAGAGVLAPDESWETVREHAERIDELASRSEDECPDSAEVTDDRVNRRWTWYRRLEDGVLDLSNSLPAGTEDYEARKLFEYLTQLRRAIQDDADAHDERGEVALASQRMRDVLRRLKRRVWLTALDDPAIAAKFVLRRLEKLPVTDVAELLGVSTRTVGQWRLGKSVRQNAERVTLVAKLLTYLVPTMTQTGVLLWFRARADQLDGQIPLDLLARGEPDDYQRLVSFARAGRGQLAD